MRTTLYNVVLQILDELGSSSPNDRPFHPNLVAQRWMEARNKLFREKAMAEAREGTDPSDKWYSMFKAKPVYEQGGAYVVLEGGRIALEDDMDIRISGAYGEPQVYVHFNAGLINSRAPLRFAEGMVPWTVVGDKVRFPGAIYGDLPEEIQMQAIMEMHAGDNLDVDLPATGDVQLAIRQIVLDALMRARPADRQTDQFPTQQ